MKNSRHAVGHRLWRVHSTRGGERYFMLPQQDVKNLSIIMENAHVFKADAGQVYCRRLHSIRLTHSGAMGPDWSVCAVVAKRAPGRRSVDLAVSRRSAALAAAQGRTEPCSVCLRSGLTVGLPVPPPRRDSSLPLPSPFGVSRALSQLLTALGASSANVPRITESNN